MTSSVAVHPNAPAARRTFARRLSRTAVGALALLALAAALALAPAPARAEGAWQLGLFEGETHRQPIREGNLGGAYYTLNVDILAPGEVINVHLCGTANTDDVRVVMLDPGGATVYDQALTDSNVDCTSDFDTTWDPAVTNPFQHVTTTSGTYELRLYNNIDGGTQLNRYDVTVTDDPADIIDPRLDGGRLWTTVWNHWAGAFTEDRATDADLYVVADGGFAGTYAIWQLDLNNFAGFGYTLKANDIGVTNIDPDTNVSGLSVPKGGGNTNTEKYPIYVAYPAKTFPLASQQIIAENFRFLDDEGQDAAISPGVSGGSQDTGSFFFETNNTSEAIYEIVLDIGDGFGGGPDGVYGRGDVFLFDRVEVGGGTTNVTWNGNDNNGNPVAEGFYTARLRVRVGEFHFVADDVETSGGPSAPGIKINKALSSTSVVPTIVYWDDFTVQNSPEPDAFNVLGIYDGEHSWGTFGSGGPGNNAFIDTYTYSQSSTPEYISVGIVADDIARPTIVKSFVPATVVSGDPATMRLEITNNDPDPITGVNFTDALPAGMTLAEDPSALALGGAGCTGFATDAATVLGGTEFNVSDGTVPGSGTCTLEIDVGATLTDLYDNVTSGAASDQATAGPTSNTASLRVVPGASGPGFVCDATSYLSGGTFPTRLYRVDRSASTYALDEFSGAGYSPSSDYSYDALGYNPVDGYLYAVVRDTTPGSFRSGSVLRIDANGTIVNLGRPVQGPQLAVMPPTTTRFVGGSFAEDGTYYVVTDDSTAAPAAERSRILSIDVAASPPEVVTNYGHGRSTADIAVHPDGTVYGYTASDELVIIDPATGSSAVVGVGSAGSNVGAMTFDARGRLTLLDTVSGTRHSVDLDTGATTPVASGATAPNGEGASCPTGVALEKRAVPDQAVAGGTTGYEFTLYNASNAPLTFNLTDTLDGGRTFVADSLVDPAGGTANAYGGTDTLQVAGLTIPAKGSETLSVEVRLPIATPAGPQLNQATLGGVPAALGGDIGSDDPASAAYGDPTTVNVIGSAVLGVAKNAFVSPTSSVTVIMEMRLDNLGTLDLANVSLPDDLDEVFGAGNYSIASDPIVDPLESTDGGSIVVNPNFSGSGAEQDILVPGSSTLAAGATALIRFAVLVETIADRGDGPGYYSNQVTGSATDPLGGIHSDLSDSGTLSDTDGDGDPTETIADGGDSDENDRSVFAIVDELINGDPPPPVNMTKSVVDLDGGDAEPGDRLRYTLSIGNALTDPISDLTVTDDLPPLLEGFTLIATPIGTTATFSPAPDGANGNGVLTVSDLDMDNNTSADIVFEATIAASAGIGAVIRNEASVDYPAGDNDSDAVTTIVYAPFAPAAGTKPLYLIDAATLSRTPLASDPPSVNLGGANSRRWSLSPATTDTLTLEAGTVPVYVWMSSGKTEDFPLRVRLNSIGATGGPISAELSQTVTIASKNVPQLVLFELTLASDVTLAAGSQVQLELFNDHDQPLDIYPRNGTHSRVEPEISTVIRVDSVDAFDAPYPGGTARDLWFADETLQVRAEIADPFGAADISGATLSVRDPSGATVYGPVSMGASVTSTAGTRTFEAAYTLPASVATGTWRLIVTGEEGTEGTVTHSFFRDITVADVPLDFGDAPDPAFGTAPGDYRTRLADDGARHEITGDVYLGAGVDAELDGFVDGVDTSGDAADDDTENGDDEDGVTFTTALRTGLDASATVQSFNGSGSTAYLNAWIDFDGDGDFTGAGERIATDLIVPSGSVALDFTVPQDALIGRSYARFRYSTQSGLGPDGLASSGEVEDHPVTIEVAGFTVAGRVFSDRDVDGSFGAGDAGLSGVTVVLRDDTLGTCIATTTDGAGRYAFALVLDGAYTVHESAFARVPVPDICPPPARDPAEHLSVGPNSIAFAVAGADVGGLDFADAREPSLLDEHASSVEPGGAAVYPHRFVAGTDGSVAFGVGGASTPPDGGWSTTLYRDTDCDARLGGGDTPLLASVTVSAGERVCVLVKVNASGGAPAGARHLATLSATFTYADPATLGHGLESVRERTDVTTTTARAAGRLVLDKLVENLSEGGARARSNAADTGDVLRYTVTFENAGAGGVSDLRINDATPAFTSSAAPVACPGTLPPGLSACTVQVPAAGANTVGYDGPIEWRFVGTLLSGGRGELSFDVVVE